MASGSIQASGMDAGASERIVSQIMELSSAATQAVRMSQALLERVNSASSSSSTQVGRMDASKVLKLPDTFSEDDPVKFTLWQEQFLNWICFVDPRYNDIFNSLSAVSDETVNLAEVQKSRRSEVTEMAHRLYSILASYLRGAASQVVRANVRERNGFQVWKDLQALYLPKTRPRALALGQAIIKHPPFHTSGRSMMENLLQFDQLLEQYAAASGQAMPDNLIVSTILGCVDAQTKKHLQLTMSDDTDYQKLKEKLILYERNSRTWSGDAIMKSIQDNFRLEKPSEEPSPMEVDSVGQVGLKGKKGKGGKGKGKNWGGWTFGAGKAGSWGAAYRNPKGKAKGKDKKGKKGKGKKGKDGKGKGVCRICGQPGHWGNECPNRQHANQVEQQHQPQQHGTMPSQPSMPSHPSSQTPQPPQSYSKTWTTSSNPSTAGSVRQVKLYHATPPSEVPEQFEIASKHSEDWYVRMVSEVCPPGVNPSASTVEEYYIGDEEPHDEDVEPLGETTRDGWREWFESDCLGHVRAVQSQYDLIILDSGADVSLLPHRMVDKGFAVQGHRAILQDAQGKDIKTYGKRRAQVGLFSNDQEAVLEDDFVVASVASPLISLGRLTQKGWRIGPSSGAESGMELQSPDGYISVPIKYKKNSLAIEGCVRSVEMHDAPAEKVMSIYTVVELKRGLYEHVDKREWYANGCSDYRPYITIPNTVMAGDPLSKWDPREHPLRTTLVRQGDGNAWEVFEHCQEWHDALMKPLETPHGVTIFMMLHRQHDSLETLGKVVGALGAPQVVDSDNDFRFRGEVTCLESYRIL